jgi:cytochrome c biogenesis protein CcmG/thiol:disulfide interchange protein DsbE
MKDQSFPRQPKPPVSRPKVAAVMIALGILMVAAAGIILATNSGGSSTSTGSVPARIGAHLDNFSLPDLNGKAVQLSDYAGRPVLINAWATWCPPCQMEMPDLNAYYQKYRSQGLVILAVNAGETASQASTYVLQLGLTFPVLLDSDERLMDVLHINDYPTSILVGRDGVVKAIHIGSMTQQIIESEITPFLNP